MADDSLERRLAEVDAALPGWMAGGGSGFMSAMPLRSMRETGRYIRERFEDRPYFFAGYWYGKASVVGVYGLAAYMFFS